MWYFAWIVKLEVLQFLFCFNVLQGKLEANLKDSVQNEGNLSWLSAFVIGELRQLDLF